MSIPQDFRISSLGPILKRLLALGWLPCTGLVLCLILLWISESGTMQAEAMTFDDVLLGEGEGVFVAQAKDAPKAAAEPEAKPKEAQPALTEEQKKIQAAVYRGVVYLQATQNASGNWGNGQYPVGYAAMPGLAMLEVGVPANDPSVQRAAYFVRAMSPKLDTTYELALAILFLDKLGNKNDEALIRVLALRLVAGQTLTGGWSYRCPLLNNQESTKLVNLLYRSQPKLDPVRTTVLHPYLQPLPKNLEEMINPLTNRQKETSLDPLASLKPLFDPDTNPLPRDPKWDVLNPVAKRGSAPLNPFPLAKPDPDLKDPLPNKLIPPLDDTGLPPLPDVEPPAKARNHGAGKEPPPATKADAKPGIDADKGPPRPVDIGRWPWVPSIINQFIRKGTLQLPQAKGKGKAFGRGNLDDNSNTQFAILGLWAARRHGIPVNLSLIHLDERFRASQQANGTWDYHLIGKGVGTPPMTCVGLLGLGVAHGVFQETAAAQKKSPPGLFMFDPAIQKGLAALSQALGPFQPEARINLYFLWSLERVMVMYQLPTLGNTRWYSYGADLLLPRQSSNGSWSQGAFHGSTDVMDTSMALLFLGRANLSRDLSDGLRRYMVVLDPALTK